MKNILLLITISFTITASAQVGINTSAPKATLDITAQNPAAPLSTDGLLIPRITSFPTIGPFSDIQEGMLVYMDDETAYAGVGFYFWDDEKNGWLPLGESQWIQGTNAGGDDLMYAANANANGKNVVIKDDGFVGLGTDDPSSELAVVGIRNNPATEVELRIENTDSEAEIRLIPGGLGSANYTLSANNDTTNGLSIYEDAAEQLQIKTGGDLRIEALTSANNAGVVYPASVYVETDGTVKVKTAYSRLDDLTVNATNFATVDFAESEDPLGTDTTASLYTHTLTPTQDILLEVSLHIVVNFSKYGDPLGELNEQHNTKLYGTIVRVNGVDFSLNTKSFIGNDGLQGGFLSSEQVFIPLVADGTTYNISIHGFVQNDDSSGDGIRGTFGGDLRDRLQIVEHK